MREIKHDSTNIYLNRKRLNAFNTRVHFASLFLYTSSPLEIQMIPEVLLFHYPYNTILFSNIKTAADFNK